MSCPPPLPPDDARINASRYVARSSLRVFRKAKTSLFPLAAPPFSVCEQRAYTTRLAATSGDCQDALAPVDQSASTITGYPNDRPSTLAFARDGACGRYLDMPVANGAVGRTPRTRRATG